MCCVLFIYIWMSACNVFSSNTFLSFYPWCLLFDDCMANCIWRILLTCKFFRFSVCLFVLTVKIVVCILFSFGHYSVLVRHIWICSWSLFSCLFHRERERKEKKEVALRLMLILVVYCIHLICFSLELTSVKHVLNDTKRNFLIVSVISSIEVNQLQAFKRKRKKKSNAACFFFMNTVCSLSYGCA